MTKTTVAWSLALGLLLPTAARAQQDPMLIGEGAQVYSANCGRCHNARSSTERNDAEWATIVQHMRARANLTKSQANAVLAYLQATNIPEGTSMANDMQSAMAAPKVVMPAALRAVLAGRKASVDAGRPGKGKEPGGS